MAFNKIIFYRESRAVGTFSEVNTRTYFCCEPDCNNVAYLSLAHRCGDCYNAMILRQQEEGREVEEPQCLVCGTDVPCENPRLCKDYFDKMSPEDLRIEIKINEAMLNWADRTEQQRAMLQKDIDRMQRILNLKEENTCGQFTFSSVPLGSGRGCVDCGKDYPVGLLQDPTRCPSCIMANIFPCQGRRNSIASPRATGHHCSGESVDNGRNEYFVCDNRDDPLCPQHLALTCNTCGCTAEFRDGERVCWCDSCQKTGCDHEHHCSGENEYRPEERLCEDRADPRCPQHTCAECGEKPEDGHFPYYRGNDPLCTRCAPNTDDSDDWRTSSGRCSKCDFFYDLICSSDRRDLCYNCQ